MKYTIRKMKKTEYPLLNDFLYNAIFIPDGVKPPSRAILTSPELQVYIDRFGEQKDDLALVAELSNELLGHIF